MGKQGELIHLDRVVRVVRGIKSDLLKQAGEKKGTEERELLFAANSFELLVLTLQSQSVIDFMRSQGR